MASSIHEILLRGKAELQNLGALGHINLFLMADDDTSDAVIWQAYDLLATHLAESRIQAFERAIAACPKIAASIPSVEIRADEFHQGV